MSFQSDRLGTWINSVPTITPPSRSKVTFCRSVVTVTGSFTPGTGAATSSAAGAVSAGTACSAAAS